MKPSVAGRQRSRVSSRRRLWILWSIIGLMVTVYLALKLNATARIR